MTSSSSSSSLYSKVEQAPPDAILGLTTAFKADTHPDKLNLGVGAYRTEEGQPWVLPVVRKVERAMTEAPLNKEYLPIQGLTEFREAAAKLLFGADSPVLSAGRAATVQSLSGTGSLRLAAEFIAKFWPDRHVYLSSPTWGNHNGIFGSQKALTIKTYRYWDKATRGLDFKGYLEDVKAAQPGSFFILHACAHNPTGVDPTPAQWSELQAAFASKGHVAVFDTAYQGFATGDLEADAAVFRAWAASSVPVWACQSFAKNMGLYGERVGAFHVVAASRPEAERVLSQVKILVRRAYSSPPIHGARVAATVLGDPKLRAEWAASVASMAGRIASMRSGLAAALKEVGAPGNWSHITDQIGMFSFTGLTPPQVKRMTDKWHVHMLGNGRISMAGLSQARLSYLATAIKDVVEALPEK